MKKGIFTLAMLLLTAWSAGAADIRSELSRAGELLETGKPDSAAVLLYDMMDEIGEEQKGERVQALYYLSVAMKQLGRLPDEINYLIMAREVGGDAPFADRVRHAYARILLDTGNPDDCIGIYREFREQYETSPLMPDMLYVAGNAYLMKNDFLRAFNSFNEITKNHPDSQAARESVMKEGLCLFKLELITGAIERLEQYLFQSPEGKNIDDALYFLGLSYERSEEYRRTSDVFNRLVTQFPSYPDILDVHFRLGELYYRTNRFAEAENAFENYIYNTVIADEQRDEALYYMERIKYRTGIYGSEADIAENFIAKYPESPRTPSLLFELARFYKTVGKTDDAIEKYRILINNPLYHAYADSAVFLIADSYVETGQRDTAALYLIRTAEESLNPERSQRMYFKLGSLNEAWERYDEAIGWYDSALAADGSYDLSFRALWGIGRTFKALNRWFEASKTFERLIADFSDHPQILDIYLVLADVYFLQGRIESSIDTAEKAAALADGERKNEILLFVAELYEDIDEEHALSLYSMIYNDTSNAPKHRTKALMQFGDLSLRAGKRAEALNAYNRILSEDADSVTVIRVKEKISNISERSVNDNLPHE